MDIILQIKAILLDQIPIFIGFLTIPPLIEYFIATRVLKKKMTYKDAPLTTAIGLVEVMLTGLVLYQIYPLFRSIETIAFYSFRNNSLYWFFTFIAAEFIFYIAHYVSHKVRWFWNEHRVHHSSKEMNLFMGNRNGWTFMLAGMWIFTIPIVILGFKWNDLNLCLFFILNYQFFVHTELIGTMGVLERILNTPSIHRVHHATQKEYLDKNFGGVTLIFDYLFKTLQREIPGKRPLYGLDREEAGSNIFAVVFAGWKQMFQLIKNEPNLLKKLKCLYSMKKPNLDEDSSIEKEEIRNGSSAEHSFRISS